MKNNVATLLQPTFPITQVNALLGHHEQMVTALQKGEWEKSILRAGKLVESVTKCLWLATGNSLPRSRDFKVDLILRDLERLPKGSADDTIRLTIPRMCRAIYDIASNRGARHDPDEIDPNVMDATVSNSVASWILAEMIRFSQKGSVDPAGAKSLVEELTQKKFPVIEDVNGRVYFHLKGLGARGTAILALWRAHPGRIHKDDLSKLVQRHGNSRSNTGMAIKRIRSMVDDDGAGSLKLLLPGIVEAERILAEAPDLLS
jgi:hypothetical protein